MDVRDIQLVVVYGVPDSMTQLHQVNVIAIVHMHVHVPLYTHIIQLCGRAGRGGMAFSFSVPDSRNMTTK